MMHGMHNETKSSMVFYSLFVYSACKITWLHQTVQIYRVLKVFVSKSYIRYDVKTKRYSDLFKARIVEQESYINVVRLET